MIGVLPISTAPALAVQLPYRAAVIMDDSIDCDTLYGVAEIHDYDSATQNPKVRRPTTDSIPAPACVVFPGSKIAHSATARVEAADFSRDSKPVLVTLDTSSSAPAIGNTVGTMAGSWGMKVGNFGFVVVGIAHNSSPYVVYVRPAGAGGGGGLASLLIVQATANGSSGSISAKTMTLKSDVTLSPNYTLAANAVTYSYFKA